MLHPSFFFPRIPDDLVADKKSSLNGINFALIIKILSFFFECKKNEEKSHFEILSFEMLVYFVAAVGQKKKMF